MPAVWTSVVNLAPQAHPAPGRQLGTPQRREVRRDRIDLCPAVEEPGSLSRPSLAEERSQLRHDRVRRYLSSVVEAEPAADALEIIGVDRGREQLVRELDAQRANVPEHVEGHWVDAAPARTGTTSGNAANFESRSHISLSGIDDAPDVLHLHRERHELVTGIVGVRHPESRCVERPTDLQFAAEQRVDPARSGALRNPQDSPF